MDIQVKKTKDGFEATVKGDRRKPRRKAVRSSWQAATRALAEAIAGETSEASAEKNEKG
jgi:hypothetical protein